MKSRRSPIFSSMLAGAICGALFAGNALAASPAASLPVIQAQLTAPPFAPPPITRKTPAKVVVDPNGREGHAHG